MAIAPGGATVAATVVEGRVGIGVGAVVAVAVAPAVGEDVEAVPTAPEAVGPARLDAGRVDVEGLVDQAPAELVRPADRPGAEADACQLRAGGAEAPRHRGGGGE